MMNAEELSESMRINFEIYNPIIQLGYACCTIKKAMAKIDGPPLLTESLVILFIDSRAAFDLSLTTADLPSALKYSMKLFIDTEIIKA